ncbi:LysR substrate-binding domain-containing protein [Ensifer adhaerens]|uniref:LysR substrate-binding domain-containing protein n=1 Tax=Ensifer adhaerens TaxID=106592 RepID=UPI003D07FC65
MVDELFDFRRRPARISPDVLAPSPVLLYELGGNTRRIVDEWLARSGTSLRPLMSLGRVEAIKGMGEAGLGCAVLPGMAVADKESQGERVVRPFTPKLSRRLTVGGGATDP